MAVHAMLLDRYSSATESHIKEKALVHEIGMDWDGVSFYSTPFHELGLMRQSLPDKGAQTSQTNPDTFHLPHPQPLLSRKGAGLRWGQLALALCPHAGHKTSPPLASSSLHLFRHEVIKHYHTIVIYFIECSLWIWAQGQSAFINVLFCLRFPTTL